jgi:hypothetical protein
MLLRILSLKIKVFSKLSSDEIVGLVLAYATNIATL